MRGLRRHRSPAGQRATDVAATVDREDRQRHPRRAEIHKTLFTMRPPRKVASGPAVVCLAIWALCELWNCVGRPFSLRPDTECQYALSGLSKG